MMLTLCADVGNEIAVIPVQGAILLTAPWTAIIARSAVILRLKTVS